jgi:ubiquinone/menaquinone biosynthesis C-methylase UbiE
MISTENSKAANWGASFRLVASEKWRKQSAYMGHAVTEAIVEFAAAKSGMHILDLASGTGEPAISLSMLVGSEGRVTGIDLSADLLEIARERAKSRGLENIEFQAGNAHALPFTNETFDLVTSRLGVMFFDDISAAMREAHRVLKPGGRVAYLVWGPFEQPYFQSTIGVILRQLQKPATIAGEYKMFRFAKTGSLSSVLSQAGFRMVHEESRTIPWNWPGTPEEVWEYFRSVTAPFRPLIESIQPQQVAEINHEICTAIRQYYDGKQINFGANMILAGASK